MNKGYYKAIIGFTKTTTPILEDLERLGCPNVKIDYIDESKEIIRINSCTTPTFADVFDWLIDKGYSIHIVPCSTYASSNHNAWWWELNVYDVDDAYDKREYSDTDMYCVWQECALAAIKKAIEVMNKSVTAEKTNI